MFHFSIAKNNIGNTALRVFFRSPLAVQIEHLVLSETGCDDDTAALFARRVLSIFARGPGRETCRLRSLVLGGQVDFTQPTLDIFRKLASAVRVSLGPKVQLNS